MEEEAKMIDATPPDAFPNQVIVQQDPDFARRHPQAAYYLRVKLDDGSVDTVSLHGAVCLADARKLARERGYEPTHYTLPGDGRPFMF